MSTPQRGEASAHASGSGTRSRHSTVSSYTERGSLSPQKKASPSDVIFGQPPGRDAASRVYETLAADVDHTGTEADADAIQSGQQASTDEHTSEQDGHGSHDSAVTGHMSSSIPESGSEDGGSDAAMEVERPASSFHATPSTTATTENSLAEAPMLDEEENVKVLPNLFEDAEADDIVVLVADMLIRLTAHNDMLPLHPSALTRFHSRAAPSITVLSYLKRIARYTSLEKSCTLILLVYIDRVCQRITGFTICTLTVHRFVCAAVVCASKALCDSFSTNGHYARVGGISLVELNMLEKEFLNIIDWKLSCSGALLQHYYTSLVRSHGAYRLGSPTLRPVDDQSHATT